jgi:hypothetical protein
MADEGQIYGDGVNIAARVESMADAGKHFKSTLSCGRGAKNQSQPFVGV